MKPALTKEQIITIADTLGFKLTLDRFHDIATPFIRFNCDDDPDAWIWFKDANDETNLGNGREIISRIEKKKLVNFLTTY
jgi:hypothetical protein